jgi:hypothetical protein
MLTLNSRLFRGSCVLQLAVKAPIDFVSDGVASVE